MSINRLYNQEEVEKNQFSNKIKHLAFYKEFSRVQSEKQMTNKLPNEFISIDIETDVEENKVMLIGANFGKNYYRSITRQEFPPSQMLEKFSLLVRSVCKSNKTIVYWKNFDAYQILNLFIEVNGFNEEEASEVLQRYGTTRGKYNSKIDEWSEPPVVSYQFESGLEFGILSSVRDCLTFYVLEPGEEKRTIRKTNSYCIHNLFNNSLENSIRSFVDPTFKKGSQDLHIIDWNKYNEDEKYKKLVNLENRKDCYLVELLAYKIDKMFHSTFGSYLKFFYGSGSLAKAGLSRLVEKEELEKNNMINMMKEWVRQGNNQKDIIKLHNVLSESYSGGQIDLHLQGMFEDAAVADITSCFPSILRALPDFSKASIKSFSGKGITFDQLPTPKTNRFIFVTATVEIFQGAVSSLTQKVSGKRLIGKDEEGNDIYETFKDNARLEGLQTVSDLYEAFDFVNKQGKLSFHDIKEYIVIEIKEEDLKENIFRKIIDNLFKLRMTKTDENERDLIKKIINSLYGLLLETNEIYEEDEENEIQFIGQKTGAFYNLLLGTMTTSYSRLRLCEARLEIEKNGGEIIQELTDSLHWIGNSEMLPKQFPSILSHLPGLEFNGWEEKKTFGMFEQGEDVKDYLSLHVGFYEYIGEDGYVKTKTMGYSKDNNTRRFLLDKLEYAIDEAENGNREFLSHGEGVECIPFYEFKPVSPGEIVSDNDFLNYKPKDLGRITKRSSKRSFNNVRPKKEYKEIVKRENGKRTIISSMPLSLRDFIKRKIEVVPVSLSLFLEINTTELPSLRKVTEEKELFTEEDLIDKKNQNKTVKKRGTGYNSNKKMEFLRENLKVSINQMRGKLKIYEQMAKDKGIVLPWENQ